MSGHLLEIHPVSHIQLNTSLDNVANVSSEERSLWAEARDRLLQRVVMFIFDAAEIDPRQDTAVSGVLWAG